MNILVYNNKLNGQIQAISSKSYAHRAIFCAGLAKSPSIITLNDLSEDIESSLRAVNAIGTKIQQRGNEFYFEPGELNKNLVVNVGESGSTLRFIIPILACLGIKSRIIREGSLINRTNSVYFDVLPKHGITIFEDGNSIYLSGKLKNYDFSIPGNVSSQFISGLLLASGLIEDDFKVKVIGELESKPYVDMTIEVMKQFGIEIIKESDSYLCKNTYKSANYVVEKDWSNALFFLAAGVKVMGLNYKSSQGDIKALDYLKTLGYEIIKYNEGIQLTKTGKEEDFRILDGKNMPDTIPILSVISALSKTKTKVINIERLKYKESNRIKSTIEMLENLGVVVKSESDSFSFCGINEFKSAKINSYKDHRIAMSAAIAACFSDGKVEIVNSECVSKSYKNFFKDFMYLGGKIDVL